jgi:hypothetical protein
VVWWRWELLAERMIGFAGSGEAFPSTQPGRPWIGVLTGATVAAHQPADTIADWFDGSDADYYRSYRRRNRGV